MIYLIIASVSASLFSVIMKIGQNLRNDGRHIIFIGYLVGAIVMSARIFLAVCSSHSAQNISMAQALEPYMLSFEGFMFTLLQGFLFLAGFVLLDTSTCRNGVALSTVAARASLILPVIFSWLLLSQPAPVWYPVVMVIVAMAMIIMPDGFQQHKEHEKGGTTASFSRLNLSDSEYQARLDRRMRIIAVVVLVAVFLVSGISDFTLKLVQNSVDASKGEEFLNCQLGSLTAMIFIMSALLSFMYCLVPGRNARFVKPKEIEDACKTSLTPGRNICFVKPKEIEDACQTSLTPGRNVCFVKPNWKTVLCGTALGLVNIACTSCILRALNTMPTHVFYPLYNIFIVIIASLVGVFCFKERLKWMQIAGLVLAVAAIALTI